MSPNSTVNQNSLAITAVYFRWTQRERREDEGVALRQPRVNRAGLVVPPAFPQG